ncbi:MAG: RsmB/NOP family class I SAM-dependent RNA methyltransferase [Bacteroidia bacterium]|jgi:16S rRNA (cytosine967-C5)-methyltransferase|nr:RsmB/NOP family class I SAM-dependent RNA methyltransferase [Bacteroidia bacterium]
MKRKPVKQVAKPHRILLQAIVNALHVIFTEAKYADKVIEKTLKENPKFGGRDRRFIAETTYDIVRNYRLLSYLANTTTDFWQILGVHFVIKYLPIPPEREFKDLDEKKILDAKKALTDESILQSYPEWLWNTCESELGKEKWSVEAKALNEQAKVVLRTNTLKTKRDILKKHLAEKEIEVDVIEGYENALVLTERQNIFNNELFKLGLFELQDAGSQAISEFLEVEPGMRIIDACAGGGGKTLHLSALMQNKGRIISMDITQWKLDELKKRARRATASNVEPRLIESTKTIKRLENTADRLLLDVPCSGLGVIKRNPDAKWKLDLDFIDRTKAIQKQILNDYSIMTKKGGYLVYSTCSILPSENREQVNQFLEKNKNFEFVKEKSILPSEGFDGFYMALIKRNG